MCQLVHVNELRNETLEILGEEQDEHGGLMTAADADQYEQSWEAESPEFFDLDEIALAESADGDAAETPAVRRTTG